jgi:hypothetical protein
MRCRTLLAFILLLVAGPALRAGDGGAEQQRVIARIQALGGKVKRDDKAAGQPVVDVDLRHTMVTDKDLALLKDLPRLETLVLSQTGITDKGLVHLQDMTQLLRLYLHDTKITDLGLGHLKGLTQLVLLVLGRTAVSDRGLEHLQGMTNLILVNLPDTQVTDEGFMELKKVLPKVVRFNKR